MKKLLALILMLSLLVVCAGSAEETEAPVIFQSGNLSLELPDGIVPLEDSDSYTAAAASDFGDGFEICLIASDAAQIRLVTVSSAESTDGAQTAAETSATTLLGNTDTLEEFSNDNVKGFTFSCSIDSVNYDICYLADSSTIYCIVSAGLSEQEQQGMLDSVKLA